MSVTEGHIAQELIHGCVESGVHLEQQDHPYVDNHSYAVNQQEKNEEHLLHIPSARKSRQYELRKQCSSQQSSLTSGNPWL